MKRILNAIILLVFVALSAFAQEPYPELILYNGKIFTGKARKPFDEAVAIAGKKILAVGADTAIRKLAGKRTRSIDLSGRTVTPGFNDAHFHVMPDPQGFYLQMPGMDPSWEETGKILAQAVKEVPKGAWIFGTVGPKVVLDPTVTRFSLDNIAPDNPVILRAYYGHGYIANTKALPLLGIADNEPDPMGGYFERVSNSNIVNGRLWEYAEWIAMRKLGDSVPDDEVIAALKSMAEQATGLGVTSMQIMASISAQRFAKLVAKADLPVRVRAMSFGLTSAKGRDLSEIPDGNRIGSKTVISGIKWILDGTPIEHGAAVRKPYLDMPGSTGRLNFPKSEIKEMLEESLRADQQILLHCSGDRCAEAVFEAMESFGDKVDWPSKRVRIEHGDGVAGDLISRAKKLGVVIVQNPTHFSINEITVLRYGKNMNFFPLRSYFERGIPAAIGSDGPLNPFLNIMFATIHQTRPDEAISRETAVRAYTYGSAFAEFAEGQKGRIAPGQLADLAVLSQDIFTVPVQALPGTKSVLTILGGEVVYDAGDLK